MFENYPDIITIKQLMEMLKIGRSTAYNLLQNKSIKHIKYGKKYIIPKTAVINYISNVCSEGVQ